MFFFVKITYVWGYSKAFLTTTWLLNSVTVQQSTSQPKGQVGPLRDSLGMLSSLWYRILTSSSLTTYGPACRASVRGKILTTLAFWNSSLIQVSRGGRDSPTLALPMGPKPRNPFILVKLLGLVKTMPSADENWREDRQSARPKNSSLQPVPAERSVSCFCTLLILWPAVEHHKDWS